MPDTIEKLRPDRDLQCYYFDQSAIAALSETSPNGFTISGTWRQQFDWCVIEWNRDNVFEHPAFRNLPDGDLSGLTLTYDETRENCIPLDSELSPTIDWTYLRVWAGDNGAEQVYFVPLKNHATPIEGSYSTAYGEFLLSGSAPSGEFVGLSYTSPDFLTDSGWASGSVHFKTETYGLSAGDLARAIRDGINGYADNPDNLPLIRASGSGTMVRVHYTREASIANATTGANGNRFAMFAYATGGLIWDSPGKTFAGGVSPTKWRVTLDFSNLQGYLRNPVSGAFEAGLRDIPTSKVRKLRWTYAADQQPGQYIRSEFKVSVSNWTVTGSGRTYSVAGPTSRRIEDNDPNIVYNGNWEIGRGNYSGGTIRFTSRENDFLTAAYVSSGTHDLYIGTRYLNNGALVLFEVDGVVIDPTVDLRIPSEDTLIRWPLGTYGRGSHTVTIRHVGQSEPIPVDEFGQPLLGRLDFDFIELAVPTTELPILPEIPGITLATDWDTLHSVAVPPERTAWMLRSLGFTGRQNHYVGALLFYELHNPKNRYATASFTFNGTPIPGTDVKLTIGPWEGLIGVTRKIMEGETLETVILSFEQEFNKGYSTLWVERENNVLHVHARQLGTAGHALQIAAFPEGPEVPGSLYITPSGPELADGVNGEWHTDLTAMPRLNRAMRDWTRSFLIALHGYGIDAACAFSTELKHGDPSSEAGIAQRDVEGNAILLPTPAIQTNFSPTSFEFWKQVYADCARIMDEAGMVPFLQFGEEQWWYYPNDGTLSGTQFASMPFYDAWTKAEFENHYGRAMVVFLNHDANPGDHPEEVEFLAKLLGDFTLAIIDYVKASHPSARFEVLYPFDVNDTPFNRAINYPDYAWTPATLNSLKTEGLRYTFGKNLRASEQGLDMGVPLGFPVSQRSHLTGLGDSAAPWLKEARLCRGKGFESVVLFALDQFCLIGYKVPLPHSGRRSVRVRR